MREIKFRAWDNVLGRWTGAFDMDNDGVVYPAAFSDGVDHSIDIEQYTGLKDKNGREIYESDKCAINGYLTSVVRYKESMGAWYVGHKRLTKELAVSIEVKGNVHES